jgi:transcriptional regulator with XRE-family HTH domain
MMHESLPAKLRVLRARQGLTLIEAAEKLGIGRDTLSDLERGRRHPVMPTLAKIAEGYGVPVEELLEEPVGAGKAEAPESGQPETTEERRPRITIGPTGRGPVVTREMVEEALGETLTDAELGSLNTALENRWRRRGEEEEALKAEAIISMGRDKVDRAKIRRLLNEVDDKVLEWLAEGKFSREVKEGVIDDAWERIFASQV